MSPESLNQAAINDRNSEREPGIARRGAMAFSASEQRIGTVEILGYTKDGMAVHDRPRSHFHFEGGLTMELFQEALGKVDTKGRGRLKEIVEFEKPIGETTCVEVGPEDDVVYAVRKNRRGLTPMVKNRNADPCHSVNVILDKDPDNENMYTLITCFIGGNATREPYDSNIESDEELKEAEEFWQKHALLYDEDLIDQEKTNEYYAMTDEGKLREQMAARTFFTGLFVDKNDILSHIQPRLKNIVEEPHVTAVFQPDGESALLDLVGSQARITAIGYGNDGKSEGLLVRVDAQEPDVQDAVENYRFQHIIIATADGVPPKDNFRLNFTRLDQPFAVVGTYGLYTRKRGEEHKSAVASQEALKEAEKEVRI